MLLLICHALPCISHACTIILPNVWDLDCNFVKNESNVAKIDKSSIKKFTNKYIYLN